MIFYLTALSSALIVAHAVFDSSEGESCSTDNLNLVLNTEVSVYPSVHRSVALPLYFGLMVSPVSNNDYVNSTVTAVQIALDSINDNPNLLRGYSLHYTLTTSQVTSSAYLSVHLK